MKITDIKKAPKSKLEIYLDDLPVGEIDLEVFLATKLTIGDSLNCDEFDELLNLSNYKRAKSKALFLLSKKAFTKKQLCDKLVEEYAKAISEDTVSRMEELGLIDDFDYATRYTNDLVKFKHFGKARIKQELYRKGISQDIISQVLEELEVDVVEEISTIIGKKYKNCLTDEKGKNRAINGLIRLGYSYSDIKSAIGEYLNYNQYYYD